MVEQFDERVCQLAEGPWYDERTGRVGWVDILGRAVLWRGVAGDPVAGAASTIGPDNRSVDAGALATATHVGAAVPRADGGLALCLRDGPVLLDPDGRHQRLGTFADADAAAAETEAEAAADPAVRANDAKAAPDGRLWLGTMAYDTTPGAGALYRLDPGAAIPVRVLDGVTVSNGLGWSPDGTRMFYIDTPTRRIDVFDYQAGELSGRRTFASIEDGAGMPDGMCVDSQGGVWVALWEGGAVRRYRPDGTLDRVIEVGTPLVTSCAFAGDAYDVLVITTAQGSAPGGGVVYWHRPGDVVGVPVHRYAG